jgi:hypothetical protein
MRAEMANSIIGNANQHTNPITNEYPNPNRNNLYQCCFIGDRIQMVGIDILNE